MPEDVGSNPTPATMKWLVIVALIKTRGIRVARMRDNEFVIYFIGEDDEVVMTMEPVEIFEGEEFGVDFGVTNVVRRENMPV